METETGTDTTQTGNPHLIAAIRAAIAKAGGRITFAEYMRLALAHPAHGYYAMGRGAPGRAGADFLTAPETSPFFGRCLAVQVAECWRLLGQPDTFAVWEPGAGAGTLARTALDALTADDPGAYAACVWWLDDLASPALARARDALRAHEVAGRVQWGAPPVSFSGMVLTNEFADALPVHRVCMTADGLREQYVGWDDTGEHFSDTWAAPSTAALAAHFVVEGVTLAGGQIAEVSLAASAWMGTVAARLGQGYVLTIDYGDEATALYRPGRFPDGSLICYRAHTANREPFMYVGEQDMTAHVDFTALMRAGEAAGLLTLGLTTQAALLASLGLGEMLYAATQTATSAPAYVMQRNAAVRLIEPGAMGRFRALFAGKGVPATPPQGLREHPI